MNLYRELLFAGTNAAPPPPYHRPSRDGRPFGRPIAWSSSRLFMAREEEKAPTVAACPPREARRGRRRIVAGQSVIRIENEFAPYLRSRLAGGPEPVCVVSLVGEKLLLGLGHGGQRQRCALVVADLLLT